MADDEQNADSNVELDFDFAPGWPAEVIEQCRALFATDLKQVKGAERLGRALAFEKAPGTIEAIQDIVRDLAQEPWDELPSPITGGLHGQLQEVNTNIEQALALESNQDNVQGEKDTKEARLEELYGWFRDEARPHAKVARFARFLADNPAAAPSADNLAELRKEFDDLRKKAAAVDRELDSRKDLVGAVRQGARDSAGEELAGVFNEQATKRGETADKWFNALIGSLFLALFGSIGTFWLVHPDGPIDKSDIGALGLGVFILGLLAFTVRVCAQNHRINRHLEAVSKSRASACSTFQRLVASVESEDVQSAVTLTLAQSVFATEETGLVDGSGDHVTVVERMSAIVPRASGGAS